MKCILTETMEATPSAQDEWCTVDPSSGKLLIEAGTVIDTPTAWKLVVGGFAEAACDECRERVDQQPAGHQGKLKQHHDRLLREQAEFLAEVAELDEDD